jgi:large subunit ribosomal protein L21
MFAIVSIAGQQFKVEKDQELFVHNLNKNEGEKISFDHVLMVSDGKKTTVGAPNVKGASVSASVLEDIQGDKVIVFKKKRRKGYKVKNGHRQQFTKIKIDSIKA